MGRIIIEQVVSLDGFAADSNGDVGFSARFFSAAGASRALEDEQLRMLASVDAIVLGRNTYQLFEAYWPQARVEDQRVAEPINRLPKYVVSSTLRQAPWGKRDAAIVLRGDGVDAVRALQRRTAGDIVVWGSLTLAHALMRAAAFDVLRLRMLPLLLGTGRSFSPAATMLPLSPERTTLHDNGCMLLTCNAAG